MGEKKKDRLKQRDRGKGMTEEEIGDGEERRYFKRREIKGQK